MSAPREWDAATYDRVADPQTRWGAAVTDDEKPVVIAYLARHFGLDNKFKATKVRPMAK